MYESRSVRLRKEMGQIGVFFLWLLGQPLVDPKKKPAHGEISFYQPTNWWKLEITPTFQIHTTTAPNVLHRAMQRVILGFRWEFL